MIVTATIVLQRDGPPGSPWAATLDVEDGQGHATLAHPYGPGDSPGDVLEEIALALDDAEAAAIVAARRTPAAGE